MERTQLGEAVESLDSRLLNAAGSPRGQSDQQIHERLAAFLSSCSTLRSRGVAVFVTRPKVGWVPVFRAIGASGVPVLWLQISEEHERPLVAGTEHEWGAEVSVTLPSPEEAAARMPDLVAEYHRHKRRFLGDEHLCNSISSEYRDAVRDRLPVWLHRWYASEVLAEVVFRSLDVRLAFVHPDKDIQARTFIVGARRRGLPSFCYFVSLELTPPDFRPMADWILVPNRIRTARFVEYGVPPERMAEVGSVETDDILETIRQCSRDRTTPEGIRVLLLTKGHHFLDLDAIRAVLANLRSVTLPWKLIIKPHHKDFLAYETLTTEFPHRVEVRRDSYTLLFSHADLIISGMGNAVFHSLATGKPLLVVNVSDRLNAGHLHLFGRTDLPPQVRFVESVAKLRSELFSILSNPENGFLQPYTLQDSVVRDLFHSLDGRTAERIASFVLSKSG